MPAQQDVLPPPGKFRWVASRKAAVCRAIASGELSREEACRRYDISEEELRLWEHALACAGEPGLRVTRVQVYKPVFAARGHVAAGDDGSVS